MPTHRTHDMVYRYVTLQVTKHRFRPTIFPHLTLKINLFFRTKVSSYLINQDSGPALRRLPFLPSNTATSPTPVHVIVREHLCYYAMKDAVGEAIRDHLKGDKFSQVKLSTGVQMPEDICSHVYVPVWHEVLGALGDIKCVPKHVELNVDLKIWITHCYVYMSGRRHYYGLSLHVRRLSERGCYCCICMAKIKVGKVRLRLACAHLFHGECIVLWLRKSLSCPLCRCEIKTAPRIDWK